MSSQHCLLAEGDIGAPIFTLANISVRLACFFTNRLLTGLYKTEMEIRWRKADKPIRACIILWCFVTDATRVFMTFRILEISYISNVFLGFVCHSKMAPILRNYTKFFLPFFYANLYKIPGISRNSVTFYTNFLTIHHRQHILHTAEKLQDADWGWGGGKTVDAATYRCWVRRKRQFTCNDYLVST